MKPQLGVHSATLYDGVVKTAIHRFKFQKKRGLAEPLGVILVKYISELPRFNLKDFDYLVPIPLHPRRMKTRGFNQAELLAEVVGRYYEVPLKPALERIKDTDPQYGLPRDKRLTNIKEAFRVSQPGAICNKKLLLVDDIYTTGATMAECCKTLKVAGAKEVGIVTLARAQEM